MGSTIKLLQGDCLELMATLPEQTIDLVLTDPPFGTTACAWDTIIPLPEMWEQLKRIIHPSGIIVLMANEPFTSKLICSNLRDFKYRWDWHKNKVTGFLNAKKQPLRCIEDVCVFYTRSSRYYPQKTTGHAPVHSYTKHTSDGATVGKTTSGRSGGGQTTRYPTNCITHIPVMNNDGSHGVKLHPTQKPVALMEYFIHTYTQPQAVVLDFAMGSGTTAVACLNTQRQCVGMEQDPHYFKLATQRVQHHALVINNTLF